MERPICLPEITWHALARWCERVDPTATVWEAREALADFLVHGRARPKPRHWTLLSPAPGTEFVYSSRLPGVCALLADNTIVTVVTRASRPASLRGVRRADREARKRPIPYLELFPRWRWNGDVAGYDEAA